MAKPDETEQYCFTSSTQVIQNTRKCANKAMIQQQYQGENIHRAMKLLTVETAKLTSKKSSGLNMIPSF